MAYLFEREKDSEIGVDYIHSQDNMMITWTYQHLMDVAVANYGRPMTAEKLRGELKVQLNMAIEDMMEGYELCEAKMLEEINGVNIMKHYIVINDWSNDYESGVAILGVAHTLEEAREIFNNSVGDEKNHAKEHGYEIYTDDETDFDAGEEGYYAREHTRVYIQRV